VSVFCQKRQNSNSDKYNSSCAYQDRSEGWREGVLQAVEGAVAASGPPVGEPEHLGEREVEEKDSCISMKEVLFSTEGHVFLADSSFRMLQQPNYVTSRVDKKKYPQCKAH
jgi:hypothetical protein